MNVLAFDTSTEALSAALMVRGAVLLHDGKGGPAASATLIPVLQDLLAQAGLPLGALDAIAFGCGPGSFTGLRTACSVAQGLAFGADLPVLPVETLMAVAQDACSRREAQQVLAVLDARMNEVYAARYRRTSGGWERVGAIGLSAPEDLANEPGWLLAGNAFTPYAGRLPAGEQVHALPTAAALLTLAPALIAAGHARPADQALPLYVRDKVAQTTAERAAARPARMAP